MKKYILLFLTIFGVHTAYGQWDAFKQEFDKYPDISRFRFEMRGDTVKIVVVDFKDGSRSERYNFWFDGDRYLFTQKYNGDILKLTPMDVDSSRIVNEPRKREVLRAFVYPDSIYYQYRPPMNWLVHAAYQGDGQFALLGKELQHYARDIAREKDSILFFQAIIGLDGSIEDIMLTQGKGGAYTDKIMRFFKNKKESWLPMVKDGRLFRSLVDICVRLGDTGKVHTSHSSSLRIPKIEIKDYTNMWYSYSSLE